MAVTAQLVKELREKTGAPMMDCKKALDATDGNMEEAITWLREKGIASSIFPSVASNAFLQSSIPAPVFSLNSFTICAVTAINLSSY